MFEAYKVAVKLSLINNVSGGLVVMAGQFQALNKHIGAAQGSVNALERQILSLKRVGLVGGAMAAAGGFGLSMFGAPLQAAKEYETAYARFKTLNLGEEVNKQADSFARGTQAFGVSSTSLMETLRESVGMFGDMNIAKQLSPMIAELNAANAAMFQGKVGKLDDSGVRAIMRFNDMRGLTNTPEEFKRGLDLAQRLVTGSGGAIKFGDLEALAKRGGAAFKGLSDDGVMMLATVMQEQGGSATGTALMSLYQNLIAGRTTKKAMAKLADAKLATLGHVSHGDVGGKEYKTLQVTRIVGEELLRTNPGKWLMTYGVDAAKRAGAKTDSEVISFINDLVSNRTGSNMGATFTTQQFQAMRDFNLVRNAQDAQQTVNTFKGTTQGSIGEMQARYNQLMIELGNTVLPIAVKALEGLTSVIKSAVAFAREFPILTKGMALAFGVLAGLVATGGTIMLATAAFKALGLALNVSGGGTLSTALMGASKAFSVLGIAAAVFAASYGVGSAIYEALPEENKNRAGRNVAEMLAFFGNQEAKDAIAAEDRHIASQKNKPVQVTTQINMDSRKVAEAVSNHQAKEAQRPSSGATRFDGRMTPAPVGASGRW